MRAVSALGAASSSETVRSEIRLTEENFGSILTDIAILVYPPPNTAAQIAADVGCTVRNVELCLSGKQKWSGDAVAVIVGKILKLHHMRNVRVVKRQGAS